MNLYWWLLCHNPTFNLHQSELEVWLGEIGKITDKVRLKKGTLDSRTGPADPPGLVLMTLQDWSC